MKNIGLLLTCMLLTLGALAQSSSDSSQKVWFGVNVVSVVNSEYDALPMLSFDYNFKDKNHIRFQIGRKTSTRDGESGPTPGVAVDSFFGGQQLDTVVNTRDFSGKYWAFQLGYLRSVPVGKKATIYYGLDAILRQVKTTSKTDFKTEQRFSQNQVQFFTLAEQSNSTTTRYGVAPLLGFEYRASSRLKVGFEFQSQLLIHKTTKEYDRSTLQSFSFNPSIFETKNNGTNTNKETTQTLTTLAGLFAYYRL